jgi:hypothetical protein
MFIIKNTDTGNLQITNADLCHFEVKRQKNLNSAEMLLFVILSVTKDLVLAVMNGGGSSRSMT